MQKKSHLAQKSYGSTFCDMSHHTIDVEKCNFRNFESSVTLTLTLDRVEVTLVQISGRGVPTHQIRWKSEKNFCGRTDGQTH